MKIRWLAGLVLVGAGAPMCLCAFAVNETKLPAASGAAGSCLYSQLNGLTAGYGVRAVPNTSLERTTE